MKILFIDEQGKCCYQASGLLYMTSFLREQGHEVDILNKKGNKFKLADIACNKPDMIGLSNTSKALDELLQTYKKDNPNITVCVGLGWPFGDPKAMMKECLSVDFALLSASEPEYPWLNLIKCIESNMDISNVMGILRRDNNGAVIANAPETRLYDLNKLPPPVFYDHETILTTSRGCCNHCSFCSLRACQSKYRTKSNEKIIDEIKYAVAHGRNHIMFTDYSFEDPDVGLKRLKSLCNDIVNTGLLISFEANFRPNFFSKIDEEAMDLLLKAGLIKAFIGVESGNEKDLKLFNKRCSLEDCHKTIQLFRNSGAYIDIGFINFHPWSTLEGLKENALFLRKYGLADFEKIAWYATLSEGTALREKAIEKGLFTPGSIYKFEDDKVAEVYQLVKFYIDYLNDNGALVRNWKRQSGAIRDIYIDGVWAFRCGHEELGSSLQGCYLAALQVVNSMSLYISKWFIGLCDIVEKKKDKNPGSEAALAYSLKILNPDFIRGNIKLLVEIRHQVDNLIKMASVKCE